MQYRKGEWRTLCFFVPLLAMAWPKSPRSAFCSKDLPRRNPAHAFPPHIQVKAVQGWSLSVIGVRGQSQYCRVSTLLESVQYVLEHAKINLVSVLVTVNYFTDIFICSTIYKYIFPKYSFPTVDFFSFFPLLWQWELLLEIWEVD